MLYPGQPLSPTPLSQLIRSMAPLPSPPLRIYPHSELPRLEGAGGIHIGVSTAGGGAVRSNRRSHLGQVGTAVVCPANGEHCHDRGVRTAIAGKRGGELGVGGVTRGDGNKLLGRGYDD